MTKKNTARAPATVGARLSHQIAMLLRRRITNGTWSVGEKLPTLSDLTSEFRVSRVTMQQALSRLAEEGLIARHRGRGTFVIAEPLEQRWFTLATDFEGLASRHGSQQARLVECRPSDHALPVKAEEGKLARDYQFLRHVHYRGGISCAITDIHLSRDVFDRAGKTAFAKTEVMEVLRKLDSVQLCEARQTLTVGAADLDIVEWLDVPLNTPIAELRRLVLDEHQRIVYFGHLIFRGDLVRLDFNLRNEER